LPGAGFLGRRRPFSARAALPRDMSLEPWRLSRTELKELLLKYERAVEEDAYYLLQPSKAERALLGDDLIRRRSEAVRKARGANRGFVDAVLEDLPDICAGPEGLADPRRPVAEFRCLGEGTPTLPASSYGSLASVFLHLLRDWSSDCEHVCATTYGPAVQELRALLPGGGSVLVPGAGLGRLALMLASEGFAVEANDASRLFLTFADYVLNRAPAGTPLFPTAHVFSENWSHERGQYVEIKVPSPEPAQLGGKAAEGGPPRMTFVPGDFVKTYGRGQAGHRRFDAIVTCFFVDTAADVRELFAVLDSLLEEGGVWVNVGPLNWRKEARLKLSWDEIVSIWQRLGYDFVTQKNTECDYHLPRGMKMYTESYDCALTAAVKRRTGQAALAAAM